MLMMPPWAFRRKASCQWTGTANITLGATNNGALDEAGVPTQCDLKHCVSLWWLSSPRRGEPHAGLQKLVNQSSMGRSADSLANDCTPAACSFAATVQASLMGTGLLWSSPLNDQSPRIVTRMTKTTSLVRVFASRVNQADHCCRFAALAIAHCVRKGIGVEGALGGVQEL